MSKTLALAALALLLPGLVAASRLVEAPTGAAVLLYGLLLSAAGLALALTWRRAQAGMSGSMQLLVLAVATIAAAYVLGTYLTSPGLEPGGHSLALAGMTGGSRSLAGVAWPLAVLVLWLRGGRKALRLDATLVPGLSCLCISTIYAFTIYMRGSLSALDAPVFLILLGIYIWRSSRTRGAPGHAQDPGAGGGSRWPAAGLLMYVSTAISLGIALAGGLPGQPSLWAQWPAVLALAAASAALAWHARAGTAASIVMAVQVALWTLLLALISLMGLTSGLGQVELADGQKSEFLLALSQALFTVVLLSSLKVSWKGGLAMAALYVAEAALGLLLPASQASYGHNLFAVLYLCLAAALVVQDRARLYTLAGMAPPGVTAPGRRAPQADPVGRDVSH